MFQGIDIMQHAWKVQNLIWESVSVEYDGRLQVKSSINCRKIVPENHYLSSLLSLPPLQFNFTTTLLVRSDRVGQSTERP